MPYIKVADRTRLDPAIAALARQISTPGEFAYALYCILGRLTSPASYATFAMYLGAVGETVAEFRRRVVVPYEEQKSRDNGDVPH